MNNLTAVLEFLVRTERTLSNLTFGEQLTTAQRARTTFSNYLSSNYCSIVCDFPHAPSLYSVYSKNAELRLL